MNKMKINNNDTPGIESPKWDSDKIYKKHIASPAVNLCPSPPRVFLFEIKNPSSVNIKIENEYENLSCCSI